MDFSSLLGYLQSLGLLYGWLLIAAALFALGERVCGSLFGRERPTGGGAEQAQR
ncbi:MAG TPA: hypothetical protein VKW08_05825 [Xanthobacteraceae bacterium]|jgi:hypothetical protein|nr:hypothetical protein [Xanthobacteraceae bacterium]